MRKTLLLSLFVATTTTSFGQSKEKELTQAEQFSSQAGTLIERQFIDVGKIKGLSIRVLKSKDINREPSTESSALRFEYEHKGTYVTDTKISSLDIDEIDGLIKSIKNLQNNIFPSTKVVYTEISFKSRTGFEAGAYFVTDKNKWSPYVQVKKFDNNSMVYLSIEDFNSLLNMVEQAKAIM